MSESIEDDMPTAQHIPIEAAKRIAILYGYDQVVIFARVYRADSEAHITTEQVTTYGKTTEDCDVAARMGNHLKRVVRWPEPPAEDPASEGEERP